MAQAKAEGTHLEKTIRKALRELAGDDDRGLRVQIDLPRGLELTRVEVLLESRDRDERNDDEAPAPASAQPRGRDAEDEPITADELDEEVDAAADFIEGLLDAMDLPGELKLRVNADEGSAEVEILDVGTGALIGRRGQTLESIQELLRSSMQREFQRRARVVVDVEGYRARRLEKLIEKAEDAIDDVLDSGEPQRLEPMDVFERKAIHRLVASVDGVSSRSQGREPTRRVVIEAAD